MNAPFDPRLRWRPATLWPVGIVLALAAIPLVMWSGHLYYAEGGRSPDAPGMLLMSVIMTSPIWLGCWILFVALFLIRYRGGARFRLMHGGSIGSTLLGVLATAATLLFVWLLIARVDFWRFSRVPFTLHLSTVAIYCQLLRGAAAARSLPPDDDLGEVFP